MTGSRSLTIVFEGIKHQPPQQFAEQTLAIGVVDLVNVDGTMLETNDLANVERITPQSFTSLQHKFMSCSLNHEAETVTGAI